MPAKLIVHCPEHLQSAKEFAASTNQSETLNRQLSRLTENLDSAWRVELYSDFAPYSFFFQEITPAGLRGLNGGLIYHGSHDGFGSGSAPTFSVSITPTQGWSIHT